MPHADMTEIQKICVYCGSGSGNEPAFAEAARSFGKILADNRISLVYGGGSVGLMGEISQAALDHGGEVIGVIPEFLMLRERASTTRHQMIITRDLHERKRTMFDLADAFVALPGGIGTLEELVEQATWAQLGHHSKPILLGNIGGFWDPLCVLIDHMKEHAFIRPGFSTNLLVVDQIDEILPTLRRAARQASDAGITADDMRVERI
jgi:hypothetical protein